MAESPVPPSFPDSVRGRLFSPATSTVEVAITKTGAVKDAWVIGSSGFGALDDATVQAAKQTQYTGPRAYCIPVPGTYIFRITFNPH